MFENNCKNIEKKANRTKKKAAVSFYNAVTRFLGRSECSDIAKKFFSRCYLSNKVGELGSELL